MDYLTFWDLNSTYTVQPARLVFMGGMDAGGGADRQPTKRVRTEAKSQPAVAAAPEGRGPEQESKSAKKPRVTQAKMKGDRVVDASVSRLDALEFKRKADYSFNFLKKAGVNIDRIEELFGDYKADPVKFTRQIGAFQGEIYKNYLLAQNLDKENPLAKMPKLQDGIFGERTLIAYKAVVRRGLMDDSLNLGISTSIEQPATSEAKTKPAREDQLHFLNTDLNEGRIKRGTVVQVLDLDVAEGGHKFVCHMPDGRTVPVGEHELMIRMLDGSTFPVDSDAVGGRYTGNKLPQALAAFTELGNAATATVRAEPSQLATAPERETGVLNNANFAMLAANVPGLGKSDDYVYVIRAASPRRAALVMNEDGQKVQVAGVKFERGDIQLLAVDDMASTASLPEELIAKRYLFVKGLAGQPVTVEAAIREDDQRIIADALSRNKTVG